MSKHIAFFLVLGLAVAIGVYRVQSPAELVPPTGGDFRLLSAAGERELADFRGQVVVLYFGYTSCPDICPTGLATLAQALRQLESSDVQGVFISVDPARDSVQVLADYVAFFHPQLVGLTGNAAKIAEVARQYGVGYVVEGDEVSHSSRYYVIDRQGQWQQTLEHGASVQQLTTAIQQWLGED